VHAGTASADGVVDQRAVCEAALRAA
jgi:hypothetical protein